MSTFKDITYKKNDDETWTEWSKRVPDWDKLVTNKDEDKLDYIRDTIYAKIYENDKDKERVSNITCMLTDGYGLIGLRAEDLIPLLESEELLDAKIKEAYEMTEENDMFEEDCLSAKEEFRLANEKVEYLEARRENHQVAWTSEIVPCVFCSKDTAKVKRECGFDICNDCFEVNKTSNGGCLLPLSHRVCWPRGEGCDEPELIDEEEECEQCGKTEKDCINKGMMFDTGCLSIYAVDNRLLCPDCIPSLDDDDDVTINQPVITLTVAEMIAALSLLPPDAKLVMTESGFYSKSDFAEVMLPRPYKVENDRFDCDLPTGTQVYIIGHSHQSYL
jgi:hypothetical protein